MICRIEIDGVDRTGKDTLVGYLDYMSNRLMPVSSRGLLSTLTYADIFGRYIPEEQMEKLCEGNKETLVVLLTANFDDLEIRHKMSNHPKIDFKEHHKKFIEWAEYIDDRGVTVLVYNTTIHTPYYIAKEIIKYVSEVNSK